VGGKLIQAPPLPLYIIPFPPLYNTLHFKIILFFLFLANFCSGGSACGGGGKTLLLGKILI